MISLDEAMLYAPIEWQDCSEGYTDIRYQKSADGIAKITINRPQVRNAFRPLTVKEMIQALADAERMGFRLTIMPAVVSRAHPPKVGK